MRYLAKMIPNEAELWLLRACGEYPNGREPWCDLAKFYYSHNDWTSLLFAATRGLRINDKMAVYLNEAEAWGYLLEDFAALASYRLGMYKEAIEHGEKALEIEPDDERLKKNLFYYKNAMSKVDVVIPHKSNTEGLTKLIGQLLTDAKVNKIIVVTDGTQGLSFSFPPDKVSVVAVGRYPQDVEPWIVACGCRFPRSFYQ
jgi:tetratricopeptide (TPR) repeat protein